MSGQVNRPDIDLTVANAVERIRILEALSNAGSGSGFCCGQPPPIGGFGPGVDGTLAGFCADSFSVLHTGSGFLVGNCLDLTPGPAGTELWCMGIIYGCAPTLTSGSSWEIGAVSAVTPVSTPLIPILPVGTPDNGLLQWQNLGLDAEDAGGNIDGFFDVDLDGVFGPFTSSGFYAVQYAWFPIGTTFDVTLAGSIVNPGTAYGDILYWDGAKWVTLAIGTVGQILTVSAGGLPDWV